MATATETQASRPAPDGLYRYDGMADGVTGFGAVTEREIARFREQGYLVVHEAFAAGRVQDALAGLLDLLAGSSSTFDSVDYESSVDLATLDGMAAEERQDYVRKFMWFVGHDERLRALSEDPALMGVVHRIIGEEPMLFQDMALLKPPRVGREKAWHQDHAYFDLQLQTRVVGVWIALDPATTGNGCMLIKPGSHLRGPVVHFQRRDWQICDAHVDPLGSLAVPLEPGGCLFFSSLMQHGTAPNTSDERRRAVQFHYRPASAELTSREERMAVFGSEGKDVSC
jgi:phytanoyl-CoA hydroxylase